MEIKQISIHRALSELKRLNDHITAGTNEISAIAAKRKSTDKHAGKPVADVDAVLSESNATTMISV